MVTLLRGVLAATVGASLVGCATPGTRPEEMSAAEHESVASRTEADAAKATHTDASRVAVPARCANAPCWTGALQQTADAKHLIALAAAHRAAAQALRDAEARSCAGIAEADRDLSPFFHREDIAGATRWEERQGKSGHKLRGAVIEFRAVPGLTAEWLQRSLECHLARSAVLGYARPEMPFCPLALKGVSARVRSGGDRFLVEVEAGDAAVAEEIWKRASALAARPQGAG